MQQFTRKGLCTDQGTCSFEVNCKRYITKQKSLHLQSISGSGHSIHETEAIDLIALHNYKQTIGKFVKH